MLDAKTEVENIVNDMLDYFERNNLPKKAIIGISGGKDSTVVAALAAKAFGPENVIGVEMPNGVQADIADSDRVIQLLGIQKRVKNIGPLYEALCDICPETEDVYAARTNSPARIRMLTLFNTAAIEGGVVLNTCNLSEDIMGYSTLFGDSAGSYAPISKLTVTEVRAIGDELGLPFDLVHKTPSDGMCGSSDEENLSKQLNIPFFTYERLDKLIRMTDDLGGFTNEEKKRIRALAEKMHYKLQICNLPCYTPKAVYNAFF